MPKTSTSREAGWTESALPQKTGSCDDDNAPYLFIRRRAVDIHEEPTSGKTSTNSKCAADRRAHEIAPRYVLDVHQSITTANCVKIHNKHDIRWLWGSRTMGKNFQHQHLNHSNISLTLTHTQHSPTHNSRPYETPNNPNV